jgi:hypothetical protein
MGFRQNLRFEGIIADPPHGVNAEQPCSGSSNGRLHPCPGGVAGACHM